MKKTALLFLIIIASCDAKNYDTSEQQKTGNDSATQLLVKDSSAFATIKKDSIVMKATSTDTVIKKLRIDSIGQHPSVTIQGVKGKQLHAVITSADAKANIRINQVQRPDSTFDGPFGRSLDYPMKQTGTYIIIIGEDIMAGDRWKGTLQIKTWIK